jgi:hypothetical protein
MGRRMKAGIDEIKRKQQSRKGLFSNFRGQGEKSEETKGYEGGNNINNRLTYEGHEEITSRK